MQLILLGAPGAGKGTQAKIIMEKYNIPQISNGEILRQHVHDLTDLGKKAKSIMEKGQLVSDKIVLEMVEHRLSQSDCQRGFILDGFPRTIPQAEGLDKIVQKLHIPDLKVIEIYVADKTIIQRLTSRRICSVCGKDYNLNLNPPPPDNICTRCGGKIIQRDDDKEETILNRLKVYKKQTRPLIEFYQKKGDFYQVDGEKEIADIFKDIENIIK
jgi:adenylate kinase